MGRGKDYPVFLGSGEKRTGSHFLLSPLQVGFQPHPFSGTILLSESRRTPSNGTSVNTPLPGTLCIISFPDLKLLVVLPLRPPILPSPCPLQALPSLLEAPPRGSILGTLTSFSMVGSLRKMSPLRVSVDASMFTNG